MKTLWNVVSVIAVINLLALLCILVVLWQKGSLDRNRLENAWLSLTHSEAEATDQASDSTIEAVAVSENKANLPDYLPLASQQEVQRIAHVHTVHAQARRRLGDERDMLIRQLESVSAELERRQIAFEEQREAWKMAIEAQVVRKKDAQFQHTVKVLEALPAKQAKNILLEMIIQKGPQEGMQEATSYLNAMSIDATSRILREMKDQEETKVATDLLEHLRRFGLSGVDEFKTNAKPNAPNATIRNNEGVGTDTL